jgi:hypothetical protein
MGRAARCRARSGKRRRASGRTAGCVGGVAGRHDRGDRRNTHREAGNACPSGRLFTAHHFTHSDVSPGAWTLVELFAVGGTTTLGESPDTGDRTASGREPEAWRISTLTHFARLARTQITNWTR